MASLHQRPRQATTSSIPQRSLPRLRGRASAALVRNLLHAQLHVAFSRTFNRVQRIYAVHWARCFVPESVLATGKHACKSATHPCGTKGADAAALVAFIHLSFLRIAYLQQGLDTLMLRMRVFSVLLPSVQRDRSVIRFKAGRSCLDILARLALKQRLPLMIDAALNRLSVTNERRSQKQNSEYVSHRTFKVSYARTGLGTPALLRRNIFSCVVLYGLLLSGGCSDQSTQFTGIWKSRCNNYWGVQIKPNASGLYTVTFCGLSGCLAPGEWLPDTTIVNDPVYQVLSSNRILIKRSEHQSLTYTRCSKDPAWAAKSVGG